LLFTVSLNLPLCEKLGETMKIFGILILIVAVALIVSFWSGAFRSSNHSADGDVNISPDSNLSGDLITAGSNVNVQAQIQGDVAVAGSNVTIGQAVQGYVLAAGSNVNINGTVGNDLWAAGSNVSVNAPVTDNARLAGNSVTLQPQASVGRDVYMAGNRVEALGRIERDLKVGAASLRIGSVVGGSVQAKAESVTVLPGSIIHGDLVVTGPNAPEVSPQAQVLGRVVHNPKAEGKGWTFMSWLKWWMFLFLAELILGAAIIALSARWPDRVAGNLMNHPGYALLGGIIGLIVIPVICVLLAVTVIGIPLAIVLFALYFVAMLLSCVFVSYLIGGWLFGRLRRAETSPYARLAAGALALTFFASLPWIGWLVELVALMIGFGALMLERKDSRQQMPAESPA